MTFKVFAPIHSSFIIPSHQDHKMCSRCRFLQSYYPWPPQHRWHDPDTWTPFLRPDHFVCHIQWSHPHITAIAHSGLHGSRKLAEARIKLLDISLFPWSNDSIIESVKLLASLQIQLDTGFPNHRIQLDLPHEFRCPSFTRTHGLSVTQILALYRWLNPSPRPRCPSERRAWRRLGVTA